MTCILAVEEEGKIYLIGDKKVNWGNFHQNCASSKVKHTNKMLLAGAGDGEVCDFILEIFSFPKKTTKNNLQYFMKQVIPKLKKDLLNYFDGEITTRHANVLIVIDNEIYYTAITGTVVSISKVGPPFAIGAGEEFAIGAYKALQKTNIDLTIWEQITIIFEVVASSSLTCGKEWDIISL